MHKLNIFELDETNNSLMPLNLQASIKMKESNYSIKKLSEPSTKINQSPLNQRELKNEENDDTIE